MKAYILTAITLLYFTGMVYGQQAVTAKKDYSTTPVNYKKLVSRADLIYHKSVIRSQAGMPIGNGRMGSLVWTTPSAIHFQINRNDIFGNNSYSNNFYQRNTDYCGGAGFVDIDFGKEVFTKDHFLQKLSCYDGLVAIDGENVKATVLAWHKKDVMVIKVNSNNEKTRSVVINLRMLREPIAHKGNHSAISKISTSNNNIILTQQFKEDKYYCGSAVVIGVKGRKAKAEVANKSTVKLLVEPRTDSFSIYIASAAGFDPQKNLVEDATKKLELAENKDYLKILDSNQEWWHSFWKKGYIELHSKDGVADDVARNYAYYLYVMASSSRGKYPTKFNGMLWTTGGDTRQWGSAYWGANQSCLYNALFASNRLQLLQPMFNMYSNMYDQCVVAASQEWGSKGIYIPETVTFNGPATMPSPIAKEMQQLYLMQEPWKDHSEKFWNYAFTKMPFLSRWNWKKDGGWYDGRWSVKTKGAGIFGHTSHIFSRGAKIAYKYWLYYEYTMDTSWLRKYGYPMLKGIAEFYRNFPNVRKGKDRKYDIYNVNDNEPLWGGHNTVEEISAMMGIFPVAIKASEVLNEDIGLRKNWEEFLANLSPLPVNTDYPDNKHADNVHWVKGLPPIVKGNGQGLPDRNTMPVWYFDLCDRGANAKRLKIANNTYNLYFRNGINKNTSVGVLSRLPVVGVRLGRVNATKYLIPNQIHTSEVKALPNRMDQREGRQTTNAERLGRASEALEDALLQSVPASPGQNPIIYVFPAWPKSWDARFKLLSRGNFLITSAMKDGEIKFVKIKSLAGGTCRLSNPWPDRKVTLYRQGRVWKKLKGTQLNFPTEAGINYVIYSPLKPDDDHQYNLIGK